MLNRHLMLKELLREGIERSDVHPDAVFGEYDELVSNMKALKDNSLHVENYPYKFDSGVGLRAGRGGRGHVPQD